MSKPKVYITEKEFSGLVKSGAADFMARAAGYESAAELWAGRTPLGALNVSRGPEQRQHVSNFLKGLTDEKFEAAMNGGFIAELARHWRVSTKTMTLFHTTGRTYRGLPENAAFALRVGYVQPAPEAKAPKAAKPKAVKAAKPKHPIANAIEAALEANASR